MEPSVSVPMVPAARAAAAADPLPLDEPQLLRSSACGFLVKPPTALQPLLEAPERIRRGMGQYPIPLVILARLPMKMAVGTSLLIIAAKSLIGFLGDVSTQTIDWQMLLIFTGLSIVGIFIGSALSKKINEKVLKTGFGWFVLIMGIYIIGKELMSL